MISDSLRQRVLEKMAASPYDAAPAPVRPPNGPIMSSYDRRAAPAVPVPSQTGPVQSSYDSRAAAAAPRPQRRFDSYSHATMTGAAASPYAASPFGAPAASSAPRAPQQPQPALAATYPPRQPAAQPSGGIMSPGNSPSGFPARAQPVQQPPGGMSGMSMAPRQPAPAAPPARPLSVAGGATPNGALQVGQQSRQVPQDGRHIAEAQSTGAAVRAPAALARRAAPRDKITEGLRSLDAEGIRGVQAQFGLKQDGIIGPRTLAAWRNANPVSIANRAAPVPASPTFSPTMETGTSGMNMAARAPALGAALAQMRQQPALNQAAAAAVGGPPPTLGQWAGQMPNRPAVF